MPAPSLVSEEEFANLALGHLGEPSLATLDDDHPSARACRRFFAIARDASLRAAWWNFAKAETLPAAAATAAGRLTGRFVLPADCLAVREVFPDTSADALNDDDWEVISSVIVDGAGAEIETMLLACNETAPLISYTRRVTAPRLWTPDFALAFSHKLASLIAPDIARDTNAAKYQEALFQQQLPAAKRTDTREKARSRASGNLTSWGLARR